MCAPGDQRKSRDNQCELGELSGLQRQHRISCWIRTAREHVRFKTMTSEPGAGASVRPGTPRVVIEGGGDAPDSATKGGKAPPLNLVGAATTFTSCASRALRLRHILRLHMFGQIEVAEFNGRILLFVAIAIEGGYAADFCIDVGIVKERNAQATELHGFQWRISDTVKI